MKFHSKVYQMLLELIALAIGIRDLVAGTNMYAYASTDTTSHTGIPTTSAVTVTEFCQDRNWTKYKSNCYRVFRTFDYFTSAQKSCQDNGAYLVSIKDKDENNLVEKLVAANTRYNEAWIGLKFDKQKNIYEWLDKQTKYQYTNWLYEKHSSDGECIEMIPGGMWSRVLCYKKLQFVCEKAVVPPKKDETKTKLIIMITLPLSCVAIMMMFVGYLCFRSHQEIKSLPDTRRKVSQHFVDVVSNTASIGTEKLIHSPTQVTDTVQTDNDRENSNGESKESKEPEKYPERRTRAYTSPNGSEKMYKQVTFV